MRPKLAGIAVVVVLLGSSCRARHLSEGAALPSSYPAATAVALEMSSPSPSPTASAASHSSTSAPAAAQPASATSHSTSPGRVVCPSGRISATVTSFDATQRQDRSATSQREWDVTVGGDAINGTSASVRSIDLAVRINAQNSDPFDESATIQQAIGAGETVPWTAHFRFDGTDEPHRHDAEVQVASWTYGDSSLAPCPT